MSLKRVSTGYGNKTQRGGHLKKIYGRHMTIRELKGRGWAEFEQWVASMKIHQSTTQAFLEFERCFAQLSEREQRSVRMDKVLMFLRSIDQKERMAIGIKVKNNDGANGLTEDWAEV